jgi:hypothetical protein
MLRFVTPPITELRTLVVGVREWKAKEEVT